MIPRLLVILLFASRLATADHLLVCGGDEIYRIDPAVKPVTKLWSWRAGDSPRMPDELKGTFRTTADCKPADDNQRLLLCSSGGGCAMIEMPSGRTLWWAKVVNAHSIEALPGERIAVASSVGKGGDKVLLFDSRTPGTPLAEVPLRSAHGLVWDESRACLWALGFDELVACEVNENDGTVNLDIKSRHALPDKDGHDLRAVPGSPDLILSTHGHVWRFHRDHGTFRPDPDLKDRAKVKSIDPGSRGKRTAVVQAGAGHWWTDRIDLLHPAGQARINGEIIYKARWVKVAP